MCGGFGFSIQDAKKVQQRYGLAAEPEGLHARYNIRPGQKWLTIEDNGIPHVQWRLWGLIPYFASDRKFSYHTINARAEGIESKPSYRKPFHQQRCLIPMTYFFEPDKRTKPSIPYIFNIRDEEIFNVAGLYDQWLDPETQESIDSFTLITVPANEIVGKIHDRMPAILEKKDETVWIDPGITDPVLLHNILKPYSPEKMMMTRVSQKANNWHYDTPDILQPVHADEQLPL